MRKRNILLLIAAIALVAFKNDKPAYSLYTIDGKFVKYEKMIKELNSADLVFFGELHDNPIGHWMEYEITKDLFKTKKENLILSAEMFESDNQVILTEYLEGRISKKSFESEARIWPNYKTDYKPLVEFAKDNKLSFVACNVPRRYASVVHKGGFEPLDSLSDEAKQFLPPLPIEYDPDVKCYAEMLKMSGMVGGHVNENFPKAQAIKDATMAFFIMKNWSPGKLTINFNGSYHSNNFEGIIWHIRLKYPDLKIVTIANVLQEDISKLEDENKGLASFVLCVPQTMTKTR
ncbi:MAG: iron-regulated protein [Bacteroidetes bacterium]|nr:MAG: iron-regulated protein [Bacteroidota bacterium]